MQTTGATDSSGAFTISVEKAREKLSQFALPNPRFYVLNLIASAVSAGATTIEVSVNTERLLFEYDGDALTPSQLETLWNQLLNAESSALQELAVALNAARALNPVELSVESWSGEQGCRLEVEGDSLRVKTLEQPNWEREIFGNRITVRESALKKPARWLFGLQERNILRSNTHLGPAKVVLDGRDLSQTLKIGHSPRGAAWLHLTAETPGLRVEPPDPSWAPYCMVSLKPSGQPFEAVLTLGPEEVCKEESLLLIRNGIAFRRPAKLLGCSFASAVVRTELVQKNLSHTDLVKDEGYQSVIEQLRGQVDLLVVARMEHPHPLPAELVPLMLAYAPELKKRLGERLLLEERKAVIRWAKEVKFIKDIVNDSLWGSLREELLALGDSPSGQALETRLLRTLKEAGEAQFQLGQTLESVRHWERILELGQMRQTSWLAGEAETLVVLRGLCGMAVEPALCPTADRRASMLRLLGRPGEALKYCACPQTRAETLLALGQVEEAEALLREILAKEKCSLAAETLSDLLSFGPRKNPSRRKEGLTWREQALAMRTEQHPAFGAFLREDLAQLARPTVPFYKWLEYRLQASAAQIPAPLDQVAAAMEEGRQLLRRKGLGTLRLKSTLLTVESKFTPNHPFLELARSRAAHLLRGAGEWREADDLLARGHLIRSLAEAWAGKTPSSLD